MGKMNDDTIKSVARHFGLPVKAIKPAEDGEFGYSDECLITFDNVAYYEMNSEEPKYYELEVVDEKTAIQNEQEFLEKGKNINDFITDTNIGAYTMTNDGKYFFRFL